MSILSFLGDLFGIGGGGGGGAAREAEKAQQKQADEIRADTEKKAAALRTGMSNIDSAFAPFNDDYFAKLQRDYTDYALPQLTDQYDQTKKNIVYALARHGNLNSTVKGDQYGQLDKELARNLTGVEGAGMDYANTARRDVEANRQDVTGQLHTTYDADAANSLALSQAKSLAVPKASFSPLTQLFTNISAVAAQNKLASEGNPMNYGPAGARNYSGNPTRGSGSYLVDG